MSRDRPRDGRWVGWIGGRWNRGGWGNVSRSGWDGLSFRPNEVFGG